MEKHLETKGVTIKETLIPNKLYRALYKGKEVTLLNEDLPVNLQPSIAPASTGKLFGYTKISNQLGPLRTQKSMLPGNEKLKQLNLNRIHNKVYVLHEQYKLAHGNLTLDNVLIGYFGKEFKVFFIGWEHSYNYTNMKWKDEVYLRQKYGLKDLKMYIQKDYDVISLEMGLPEGGYDIFKKMQHVRSISPYYKRTYSKDYYLNESKTFATIMKMFLGDKITNYMIKTSEGSYYVSMYDKDYVDTTGMYSSEDAMHKMLSTIFKTVASSIKEVKLDDVDYDPKFFPMIQSIVHSDSHKDVLKSIEQYIPTMNLYSRIVQLDSILSERRPVNCLFLLIDYNFTNVISEALKTKKFPQPIEDTSLHVMKYCLKYNMSLFSAIMAECISLPNSSEGYSWILELFDSDSLESFLGEIRIYAWDICRSYVIFLLRLVVSNKQHKDLLDVLVKECLYHCYTDILINVEFKIKNLPKELEKLARIETPLDSTLPSSSDKAEDTYTHHFRVTGESRVTPDVISKGKNMPVIHFTVYNWNKNIWNKVMKPKLTGECKDLVLYSILLYTRNYSYKLARLIASNETVISSSK